MKHQYLCLTIINVVSLVNISIIDMLFTIIIINMQIIYGYSSLFIVIHPYLTTTNRSTARGSLTLQLVLPALLIIHLRRSRLQGELGTSASNGLGLSTAMVKGW